MLDVVAFGEVLWDLYEDAPDTYRRMLGGAPSNLAVGLARLGVRVALVGAVGRDVFGEALASRLAAEGVDTSRIVRLRNRTGIAFVHRTPRGQPRFLFYRHDTADMAVRAHHVKSARAMFAVCGTSTLLHPALRRATLRFVHLAARAGACVVVDLNVRAHLWTDTHAMKRHIAELLGHARLVKASKDDLAALGDRSFVQHHAPRATLLMTNGARAAEAIGAHGRVVRPALRARCVDATGAGDAFLAGTLAVLVARRARPGSDAWLDPVVFSDALDVGHMLGALAVSKVGAVTGLVRLGRAKQRIAR